MSAPSVSVSFQNTQAIWKELINLHTNKRGHIIDNIYSWETKSQLEQNSTYPDDGYPDSQLSGSAWTFG